ncbi:Gfo/Idh/MocA family oxidoreductase [Streptomyces sp. NPDC056653]|uniref:Gfo/Idh/MocA family oxidoreductase n=1 Tax=Streptomyces sp. NPDC056653 TaxID=3345894 RepID=UPI0036CC4517
MTSISPHQGPIRVGVVGLRASGGWAAAAHVPALAGLDGYELRALSASSAESARVAAEKYAVALSLGSAEELARSEEVDLVVVTVRVPEHLELIRPALEVGKTVFSEWPLGADLGQAKEMADLAHRRGLLTAVGLQARSAPPLRYLQDLVAEGSNSPSPLPSSSLRTAEVRASHDSHVAVHLCRRTGVFRDPPTVMFIHSYT